jgi:hypothetical protein
MINLSGVTLERLLKNQFINPTILLFLPFKNNSQSKEFFLSLT